MMRMPVQGHTNTLATELNFTYKRQGYVLLYIHTYVRKYI